MIKNTKLIGVKEEEYLYFGRYLLQGFTNQIDKIELDSLIGLGYTLALRDWNARPELHKYKFSTIFSNRLRGLALTELRSKRTFKQNVELVCIDKVEEQQSNNNIENYLYTLEIIKDTLLNQSEKKQLVCKMYIYGFKIKDIAFMFSYSREYTYRIINNFRNNLRENLYK